LTARGPVTEKIRLIAARGASASAENGATAISAAVPCASAATAAAAIRTGSAVAGPVDNSEQITTTAAAATPGARRIVSVSVDNSTVGAGRAAVKAATATG
jgi:hypothetical protein